ncbi:MAG: hypothetical protein WD052_06435 [Bacteroidales bacterium]
MEYSSQRVNNRPGKDSPIFRNIIPLLVLAIFSMGLSGQFYEYGQDPATIRWNHFSSEHYQVIYPRGLDSLAMNFADNMEYYYPFQAEVLDHKHGKLPLVFHNESSFSNGVFVWAPKRLEVFTNPDPNGYAQDWMTQLALHEGRHAVQISKLNQGVGKTLSVIAGEQAVGLLSGLLPLWYLEGDAVDAETRFSYTGRGRLPSFEMGMKAILLEQEQRYNFSKAILGSYRDHVPNHYELGYLMVRFGRRTYGDSFWTDMEDFVARKPFLVVPSWFAMRKYGVKSKRELYQSTLDLYEDHWKGTFSKRDPVPVRNWSEPGQKHYTSYRFPQWIGDTLLIALKEGIDQIPEFVTIGLDGTEKRVFRPGFMNSGRFSYSSGLIVWDEWVPDIRWSNRNFSQIRVFNLEENRVRNLGSGTRYYSPAISKGGEHIVAIEQQTDYSFHLVILDMEGNLKHSVRAPGNQFIQHPHWMEEDSAIVVTLTGKSGKYLYKYSMDRETWSEIFNSGYEDISHPVVKDKQIFFSATFSGIDNIYRFNLENQQLYRVSSAHFGAFEPGINPGSGSLSYADYHADGYRAVTQTVEEEYMVEIPEGEYAAEQLDSDPTPGERTIIDGAAHTVPGTYTPKPYRKLFHAVNIHSWLPLYFDYMNPEAALNPEDLPVSLGATLLTQNLLSTITGMVGYEYRDKMHFLHSGVILKGRIPVIDLGLNVGGLPLVHKIDAADNVPVNPDRFTFTSTCYIPLRLNTGKYITRLQPLIGYSYSTDIFPNENRTGYETGLHRFVTRFNFSSYLRMGRKDILPRLGITAFATYRNAPFNAFNFGSLSIAGGAIYLPGLLKHQTIRLRHVVQVQHPERYLFNNDISLPRGMVDILGLEMKLYSADYSFPVAYPDFNIGPVIYITRIRGNLWADYLAGRDILIREPQQELTDKNYYSVGADILADLHFLRIFFPVSIGGRLAWLPQTGEWKPEFLFTVDLF